MKQINSRMLRVMDDGWVVFVQGANNLEYIGVTPLDEDRLENILGNVKWVEVARQNELEELKTKEALADLHFTTQLLVQRTGTVSKWDGVVMKAMELDLDVATWNALRIYKLETK